VGLDCGDDAMGCCQVVANGSSLAVFRLWLATEPCRYKVSVSNPYTVGTTIGHPSIITPRWATSPRAAPRTASGDPPVALLRVHVQLACDDQHCGLLGIPV
jgi:hypothetical protein